MIKLFLAVLFSLNSINSLLESDFHSVPQFSAFINIFSIAYSLYDRVYIFALFHCHICWITDALNYLTIGWHQKCNYLQVTTPSCTLARPCPSQLGGILARRARCLSTPVPPVRYLNCERACSKYLPPTSNGKHIWVLPGHVRCIESCFRNLSDLFAAGCQSTRP